MNPTAVTLRSTAVSSGFWGMSPPFTSDSVKFERYSVRSGNLGIHRNPSLSNIALRRSVTYSEKEKLLILFFPRRDDQRCANVIRVGESYIERCEGDVRGRIEYSEVFNATSWRWGTLSTEGRRCEDTRNNERCNSSPFITCSSRAASTAPLMWGLHKCSALCIFQSPT
ncbi:hypothetical protein OBBRIDRAFT_793776 [Obba rivulosa]|uniref:Uncharacterized protein n=1 Tax=Obba rivulosa TaxID=1052685 RepID=A0A8E2AVI1_9APHY|nr:hypothetical protein OBBRIDRAFT_793776 [Obba rivulosa]